MSVTLITPVVEVDGRNRMVDVYNWHLAIQIKTGPAWSLGTYVAPTIIAMRLALAQTHAQRHEHLSRLKPQVLHEFARIVPIFTTTPSGMVHTTPGSIRILTDEGI